MNVHAHEVNTSSLQADSKVGTVDSELQKSTNIFIRNAKLQRKLQNTYFAMYENIHPRVKSAAVKIFHPPAPGSSSTVKIKSSAHTLQRTAGVSPQVPRHTPFPDHSASVPQESVRGTSHSHMSTASSTAPPSSEGPTTILTEEPTEEPPPNDLDKFKKVLTKLPVEAVKHKMMSEGCTPQEVESVIADFEALQVKSMPKAPPPKLPSGEC